MKFNTFIYLFTSIFLMGCNQLTQVPASQPPSPHHEVSIRGNQLELLGHYREFIPLENHKDALLGSISLVRQAVNGDWYVGDFRSSLKVYQFSAKGAFIQAFGNKGQGPGEWEHITGFDFFSNGELVVFTPRKLVVFDQVGSLKKEASLDYFADDGEVFQDQIWLRVAPTGFDHMKFAIKVLNSDFEEQFQLHRAEPRLRQLAFLPIKSFTKTRDHLFVSEIYDYALSAYQSSGTPDFNHIFSNTNQELETLWPPQGQSMSAEQKRKVIEGVHRARLIYGTDDGVFLLEANMDRKRLWPAWYDPETATLYKYPELNLFRPQDQEFMPLNQVAGSYDRGLIGIVDDPETFAQHQDRYPTMADHPFTMTDNPILVLLELQPATEDRPNATQP
jgi:hypothetical protein